MAWSDNVPFVATALLSLIIIIRAWLQRLRFLKRAQEHGVKGMKWGQQEHNQLEHAIRHAKWKFRWANMPDEDKKAAMDHLAKAEKAHQDGDTETGVAHWRNSQKYLDSIKPDELTDKQKLVYMQSRLASQVVPPIKKPINKPQMIID
jgi:hypothetical protein